MQAKKRYGQNFLIDNNVINKIVNEIGADKDRVHFLVQSAPDYSPTKIITTIKSITAKHIFAEHSEVKK